MRFTSQVWPGDTLDATATVERVFDADDGKRVELVVTTTNQNGVDVLKGYAEARLDLER